MDPAVSVTRRATLLLSVPKDLLTCARTARWRVSLTRSIVPGCTNLVADEEDVGHRTLECTENRKFDLNSIPDKLPEEAWAALKKDSVERDLEDFREVRQKTNIVSGFS